MSKIDLDHFEKIFAFKMMTDEEYFASVVDVTNPEYFKDTAIRSVFEILRDYFRKRDTLPNSSELKSYLTTQELKDNFKRVVGLIEKVDQEYNRDELMQNTEQYIKERAVYKTMLEVADKMQQGKADTSWVLSEFERTCNINLTTNFGLDLFNNPETLIKDLNRDDPVISSKWKWLDNKLEGGFLQNGRALYVFAGQANVGKSIVLGNVAKNIAEQGKTVLLISLEMSEMMYARRISSTATKIPIRDLRTETETLKFALQDIKARNPKGRLIIKEFPPSTITPNQLSAFIKMLRNRGIFPDAIVLDYLNLLHSPMGSNSYERVKYIAEQVRAMTYVYNCPIISATQISRQGYEVAEPGLATLSESYGMATTADFIASVYQLEEDAEMGIIRMGMMKNRFGANFGSTAFAIDYATLTIREDDEIASMTEESETSLVSLSKLSE